MPEMAFLPRAWYGPSPPGGGHIGLIFSTFMSVRNEAPFKALHYSNSYPAISGVTYIDSEYCVCDVSGSVV